MSSYLLPIKTAIIAFIILAWIVTIPYLIYKYRKQGSLPFFQAVIESSFVFYMMAAFFLTLLPLPSHEFVDALTTPRTQLMPFAFIGDFLKHTKLVLSDSSTYIPALKQGVVIQPLFNIIMTIPFGVYLRYYFKKPLKFVFFASLGLSLFYELTQLTGIYGFYSRSYRLFDVDDLFLNTLGGVLGYLITPAVVFLFPSRNSLDELISSKAKIVSKLRRFVAYVVDRYALEFLISLLPFSMMKNGLFSEFLLMMLLTLIMYKFSGKSLGLWLVRLKLVSTNSETLSLKQILKRNLLFFAFVQGFSALILKGFEYLNEFAYENVEVLIFYLTLMGIYFLMLAGHFIVITLMRRQQFFYESASHTQIVSTVKS